MPKKKQKPASKFERIESIIRSKDQFGKGIPWNMNGAGQFKTVPGGLVSILFDLIYWSYFFICLNQMVNRTSWKLTTQSVLVSNQELNHGLTHEDLGNFTFGLQVQSSYKELA